MKGRWRKDVGKAGTASSRVLICSWPSYVKLRSWRSQTERHKETSSVEGFLPKWWVQSLARVSEGLQKKDLWDGGLTEHQVRDSSRQQTADSNRVLFMVLKILWAW